MVRMANLCVVGGHAVNGVADIHSEIVRNEVFTDFYKFAENVELQSEWRAAKRANKLKAVSLIKEKTGYIVSPDAMFDVQVKRIHEYKRQLLNIMGIVYRYKKMKEMSPEERKAKFVPRVCIFRGKAFSTYVQAKRIVKFITDVGTTINHHPDIDDLLKETCGRREIEFVGHRDADCDIEIRSLIEALYTDRRQLSYMELAVLPWRFLLDHPVKSLQRLVLMIRGVADPLASVYCHLYLVLCAQKLPRHNVDSSRALESL